MRKLYVLCVISLGSLLFSCSSQSEDLNESNLKTSNLTSTIDPNSLVGEWKLTSLEADTLVDLNGDGIGNTNILAETDCFATSGVTFYQDGTYSSVNAQLDFNGGISDDEFVCLQDRIDEGTWETDGEDLLLNITIKGDTYTNRKTINQTETTFGFDVSKIESNQYVEDPGDTQASQIRILSIEYTKQN